MTDCSKDLEAVAGLMSGFDRQRFTAELERWFRTHHAEIAEALKDARRYRWLRANACDGFMRADGRSLNCDEPESEWDAWIDSHLHNSAREDGE